MNKERLIEKILLVILILLILISIPQLILNGNVIKESSNIYSYTTAICDEKNYCEDYVVKCDKKELLTFTPTGLTIQQKENWIDEREKRNLCN